MVVKVLLKMLKNTQNNVAVIGSSSSAWDIEGKNASGNVTVLTYDNPDDAQLNTLTPQYHQRLVHALDLLRPQGASDHRCSGFMSSPPTNRRQRHCVFRWSVRLSVHPSDPSLHPLTPVSRDIVSLYLVEEFQ